MKRLPLSNSPLFALVDNDVFERVRCYKWRLDSGGYVVRTKNRKPLNPVCIYLHKIVIPTALKVDHKFHNLLDNRRKMLRVATHRQNCANQRAPNIPNKSSSFKGVTWYKKNLKWGARIRVNYKLIYLGLFDSEKRAAQAYNSAAKRHFGRFAKLNKI
jgi:hypothetical protein